MFNFFRIGNDDADKYTYLKLKKIKLNEYYYSDTCKKLRETYANYISTTTNSISNSERDWISYTASKWKFNPFKENDLKDALKRCMTFSNTKKLNKDTIMRNPVDSKGNKLDISVYSSSTTWLDKISKPKLVRLMNNFKTYFTIWNEIVNAANKPNLDHRHFRTMYLFLLITVYDNNGNDKDAIKYMKGCSLFENKSARYELLNLYYEPTNRDGTKRIDEDAKNILAKYRDEIGDIEVVEFFRIILFLLKNESLGCGVEMWGSGDIVYTESILYEEIERLGNLIPLKKISPEFLNNVRDLKEWFKEDVEKYNHEYSGIIMDMDIDVSVDSFELTKATSKNMDIDVDLQKLIPTMYLKYCTTSGFERDNTMVVFNEISEILRKKWDTKRYGMSLDTYISEVKGSLDLIFDTPTKNMIKIDDSFSIKISKFRKLLNQRKENQEFVQKFNFDTNLLERTMVDLITNTKHSMRSGLINFLSKNPDINLKVSIFENIQLENLLSTDNVDDKLIFTDFFRNPMVFKIEDLGNKKCFLTEDFLAVTEDGIYALYAEIVGDIVKIKSLTEENLSNNDYFR